MKNPPNTDNISKKKDKPIDILNRIKPRPIRKDRLQVWFIKQRELWYAIGNGTDSVFLGSKKRLDYSYDNYDTRLGRSTANYFLNDEIQISSLNVFSRILKILPKYIQFADQRIYLLVAFWIMGTYLYSMFSHYGYLFFYSKLPRSGKTRIQEIIFHLAFEACGPQNAPTPPVIRELARKGGTVQLDTLERWRDKNHESFSAAMEMLDAGFRNGGMVSKMVQSRDNKWEAETYPVYAPYVLTGINRDSLSDTAIDRSFAIEAKRKNSNSRNPYNAGKCEKECAPVRGSSYVWALQNASKIYKLYESKEFQQEIAALHLNDRATDIWQPILAIARRTGYDKGSTFWSQLTNLAKEMHSDPSYREEAYQLDLIKALRKQVDKNGKVIGATNEIVKVIKGTGIAVKESGLAKLLHSWGFAQKPRRLPNGPRRAWELEDKKLAELQLQLECATTIVT